MFFLLRLKGGGGGSARSAETEGAAAGLSDTNCTLLYWSDAFSVEEFIDVI